MTKENENPTIYQVSNHKLEKEILPCIQRYNDIYNTQNPRTSIERSVNLALMSANPTLLHDAGFKTHDPPPNAQPTYLPSSITKKEDYKRDPLSPREVFDIIRTIQDPEHPLTLEQLNVVNIDYIRVFDLKCDDSKPFSYVNVGFT